jgi:hypothetical protein
VSDPYALPRDPGEDVVKWRNRCLRAAGRTDIRWRYDGRGGTELEHTAVSKNPEVGPERML